MGLDDVGMDGGDCGGATVMGGGSSRRAGWHL